jgi:hypothetical protein
MQEKLILVRAKSKRERDRRPYLYWLLRCMERRRMMRESFWDRERAELVSLGVYPLHNVDRGEVLFDHRGYVNPALSGYR